jgi:predicted nucleotidyltransferase component of viral defense system
MPAPSGLSRPAFRSSLVERRSNAHTSAQRDALNRRKQTITIRVHDDPVLFEEALNFTAAQTHFPARLVEKDYFCSVLLAHLTSADESLVFKGGTCLAKVHADFSRMSEDLDFAIPMLVTASRSQRSKRATAVKRALADLGKKLPFFQVLQPLQGARESAQYLGSISYASTVTRYDETITTELSLREPLLEPTIPGHLQTMLLDPVSHQQMVSPHVVPFIARMEAYAEKSRAALTRRDIAIRDFYDLDHAMRRSGLRADDPKLVGLIKRKIAVPGNEPVNVQPKRLRRQLDGRLKPVLRPADFAAFDLERAFKVASAMAQRLSD